MHRILLFSQLQKVLRKGFVVNMMMSDQISSSPLSTLSNSNSIQKENNNLELTQNFTYEEAIQKLNSLQSNRSKLVSLKNATKEERLELNKKSLPGTIKYFERIGLTLEELDSLRIIHVAGTKGKGTTCAFVESILRYSGLKTGFFSSPHLVAVRERIRINGLPISKKEFSQYFYQVYNKLETLKEYEQDMPAYFRFLTCLAFNVFIKEKVDVAIIEVGIGGTYDSTNIIRNPIVVGITSLGLEHQNILGDTLEEIAEAKAGIMKPGTTAITVSTHHSHIQTILENKAKEFNCSLYVAPKLEDYHEVVDLGVEDGSVSRINASLAIQLANEFLEKCYPEKLNAKSYFTKAKIDYKVGVPYPLLKWHLKGLEMCNWPGRFQVLRKSENLIYYLDGAHTIESMIATRDWIKRMSCENAFRILIFNVTGERDAESLMKILSEANYFNLALFCPILFSKSTPSSSPNSFGEKIINNWSAIREEEDQMAKCKILSEIWLKLTDGKGNAKVLKNIDKVIMYLNSLSKYEKKYQKSTKDISTLYETGFDQEINGGSVVKNKETSVKLYENIQVLVTGSIHFVGAILSIIDPLDLPEPCKT